MHILKYLLIAVIFTQCSTVFTAEDTSKEQLEKAQSKLKDQTQAHRERRIGLEESLKNARYRAYELNALCMIQEYVIIRLTNPKVLSKREQDIVKNFPAVQKDIESNNLNLSDDVKSLFMIKYNLLKDRDLLPSSKE